MGRPRVECSICKASCIGRAGICHTCFQKQRVDNKKVFFCSKCNKKLTYGQAYRREECLCTSCRKEAKKTYRECILCGNKFEEKFYVKKDDQKYCSSVCSGKARHLRSKEKWRSAILSFIKASNRYCTVEDICKGLDVSDKVLYKFDLSVIALNQELGFGLDKKDYTDLTKEMIEERLIALFKDEGYLTQSEIEDKLKLPRHVLQHKGVTLTPLRDSLGLKEGHPRDKEELTSDIIAFIKKSNQYCGVAEILRNLNIDYDCTWKYFNFSADELNALAGFKKDYSKSWFEDYFYNKLLTVFTNTQITRQKQIEGCTSKKGVRLKFDFYIEPLKILVEIDGSQHKDKNHCYYTESNHINDIIKNEFVRGKELTLIRIDCYPREEFFDKVEVLLNYLTQLFSLQEF